MPPAYTLEAEPAVGDLRNALMMLQSAAATGPFHHSVLLSLTDYEAIRARLWTAVRKLESGK